MIVQQTLYQLTHLSSPLEQLLKTKPKTKKPHSPEENQLVDVEWSSHMYAWDYPLKHQLKLYTG